MGVRARPRVLQVRLETDVWLSEPVLISQDKVSTQRSSIGLLDRANAHSSLVALSID